MSASVALVARVRARGRWPGRRARSRWRGRWRKRCMPYWRRCGTAGGLRLRRSPESRARRGPYRSQMQDAAAEAAATADATLKSFVLVRRRAGLGRGGGAHYWASRTHAGGAARATGGAGARRGHCIVRVARLGGKAQRHGGFSINRCGASPLGDDHLGDSLHGCGCGTEIKVVWFCLVRTWPPQAPLSRPTGFIPPWRT